MRTASETEPKSIYNLHGGWDPQLTTRRQFGSMAEKVADFEKLLKDLSLRVGEEDAAQIRALLEQVRARLEPAFNF
jgi:hypothetical protein